MPTLLEEPGAAESPFADLIGGDNGGPAYQTVAGRFSEVPKADVATSTDLGAFADMVPGPGRDVEMPAVEQDLGIFQAYVPESPTRESEKALAEVPKPPDPKWIAFEKGIENITGFPFHHVNNAVRVFGQSAGRYIFDGMQAFERGRAQFYKNPPQEAVQVPEEQLFLPDGSRMSKADEDALEQRYRDELATHAPAALENAAELKRRSDTAERNTPVDPALEKTVPARLAAAAGPVAVMTGESLIPAAGMPLMVMHGALATEQEALDAGATPEQAQRAAVRSAIGLGIFGGVSKLAAAAVAKVLPRLVNNPEQLSRFIAQFTGQEAANETSSRVISAWNAAADAPEGQKVQAAVGAATETNLENTVMNTMYALAHAAKASRGPKEPPTSPASEPVEPTVTTPEGTPETARYVEPAREAAPSGTAGPEPDAYSQSSVSSAVAPSGETTKSPTARPQGPLSASSETAESRDRPPVARQPRPEPTAPEPEGNDWTTATQEAPAEPIGVADAIAEIQRRNAPAERVIEERQPVSVELEPEVSAPSPIPQSETIAPPVTKAERKAVDAPDTSAKKLKVQKAYLLEAVDQAMKEAPREESLPQESRDKLNDARNIYSSKWNADDAKVTKEQGSHWEKVRTGVPTIEIEVPGDGTFTIVNTTEALRTFRDLVKKRFPATTAKPESLGGNLRSTETKIVLPGKPKGAPDLIKIAQTAASKDAASRFVITHVKSDGKTVTATDGRRLLMVEGKAGGSEGKPVYYNESGKAVPLMDKLGEGATPGKYPDVQQVIPKYGPKNAVAEIDTAAMQKLLVQAMEMTGDRTPSVNLWLDRDGKIGVTSHSPDFGEFVGGPADPKTAKLMSSYSPQFLLDGMRAASALGHEKVSWLLDKKEPEMSPGVFEAKGMKYVLMPMRMESSPEHPFSGARLKLKAKDESGFVIGGQALQKASEAVERGKVGAGLRISGKRNDLNAATTARSTKLQKSFADSERAQKEINKAVPSERRQAAIAVNMEAGGDPVLLAKWEGMAKGKAFKQAARDAQTLSPAEIAIRDKAKQAYTVLGARGQRFDAIGDKLRDNYVTHVWDVSKKFSGIGSSKLKDKFKFAKARKFETLFDGDQAGFTPKTMAIGKLLPAYMHEMNTVIADRQFVQDVSSGVGTDQRPLVIPRGNAKQVEANEYVVSPVKKFQRSVYDTAAEAQAALLPGQVVTPRRASATHVNPRGFASAKDAAGDPIDQSDYKVTDQHALSNWRWVNTDKEGNTTLLKSDLSVHPELAKRLNAMMGDSPIRRWYNEPSSGTASIPRAIAKGLDTAQSVMKREMFGLLAPFHQVQEGTHAIGHTVNPFFGIEDMSRPTPKHIDAMEHGLMILPEKKGSAGYIEGVGGKNSFLSQAARKFGGKAGRVLADTIDGYQNYLFHQYIPGLKYKTYEHVLARNMERYASNLKSGEVTVGDVKMLSAEQSNAAYGHLNYALLDRNPLMQHLMQLGLLAPDFLEARARFVGQALRAPVSKAGHEQFRAIATIALVQAGAAYTLSQLLGDEWDPKHPFEVTHNGRTYTMRSVPEDFARLFLSGPDTSREFVSARINPVVQKIDQLRTGKNYRGEQTGAWETMGELLANYIPITARQIPGLRTLTETGRNQTVTPLEQLAGSLGIKISRHSPITKVYQAARDWKEAAGLPKDTGSYPTSKYQQLRYALEDGDMDRAKAEYQKLVDSGEKRDKISSGFRESILHPFTGSQANDLKFKKSLSPEDRQLYDLAVKKRHEILKRYQVMRTHR